MAKVVVTNGCWDILHRGHIELLKYAKSLGDKLIVGVNSDESVRRLKGKDRPINTLQDRIAMLYSIGCVDVVFSYDTEDELNMVYKCLQPDHLVKDSSYFGKPLTGEQNCRYKNYYATPYCHSTTRIIEMLETKATI